MIGAASDPNWLLSTTVQASAALVGIVGGLLISRLVSLSAERSALDRQTDVARTDEWRAAVVLDECRVDRLRAAKEDFYQDAVLPIAESISNLNLDEILVTHCPRGTEVEELRPYAAELVERVRQASDHLNSMFNPDDVPLDVDELRIRGVACPERDVDIFDAVLMAIWKRRRPEPRSEIWTGATVALPPMRSRDSSLVVRDLEVRDGLIAAERSARRDQMAARARLELADAALELKGEPTRLREALTVLIVFAVMGIVYPSIILAVGPTSLTWFWRLTVVGFFLLGLALLLGYLVRSVQSLTPGDYGEPPDTPTSVDD